VSAVTVPLVDIVAITPRSRLLTVDLRGERFSFVAGQAVRLAPQGQPDGKPYSIACSPERVAATGRLELLIAIDETTDLAWAQPGVLAHIDGPLGTFTFPDPPDARRLLFVAGGTGIAPLRAMIDHVMQAYPDRRLSVLYSARRGDEFAFIDELREHERAGRIELQQTVTRDDNSGWQGRRGRIGRAEFEAVVHEPMQTLCFVCGPPSMVEESVAVLRALGVPPDAIRTEQWGK
jgi:NAD(P)H-flavin reductase